METLAVKTPGRGNLDPARNVMAWALAPQPEGGKFSGKTSGGGKPKAGTSGSPRAARSQGAGASKRDRRAPHRPYRSGEAFPHERGEYRVNNYSGPHRPRRPRNAPVDHFDFYDHDGVRLQKLMAQAGVASRRVCEEMITEGRVTVNGEVVTELGCVLILPM